MCNYATAGQSPLRAKLRSLTSHKNDQLRLSLHGYGYPCESLEKIRHRASGTRGVFIGLWLSLAQLVCPGQFAWVGLYYCPAEQSCSGNLSSRTHFARSACTARSPFFQICFIDFLYSFVVAFWKHFGRIVRSISEDFFVVFFPRNVIEMHVSIEKIDFGLQDSAQMEVLGSSNKPPFHSQNSIWDPLCAPRGARAPSEGTVNDSLRKMKPKSYYVILCCTVYCLIFFINFLIKRQLVSEIAKINICFKSHECIQKSNKESRPPYMKHNIRDYIGT